MASPAKPNLLSFGAYEFNPSSKELRKEGVRVRLEGQPLAILEILLGRPGQLVTREELQKKLWPADTFVDFEHSLNAAVKRLRSGLNDSVDQPRFIETLARRGYRFVAPVGGFVSNREIENTVRTAVTPQMFAQRYADVFHVNRRHALRLAFVLEACGWVRPSHCASQRSPCWGGGNRGIARPLPRYLQFVPWLCCRWKT